MTTEPSAGTRPGIFDGLRIVEFGQYVAAPYAAEQFAHGGAEVICVEPVAGTPTRISSPGRGDGRQFVVKARGKQSVAVAIGTDEGRRIARELCRSADVVISNLRPGAAAALGIDFESLRADRPDLIYGEVDGFGDAGPLAGKACVDLVAQASGGLLASLAPDASLRLDRQQLLCDYGAGMILAFGVAAALFHRERTGEGQRVATSLVAAALMLQHRTASVIDDHEPWKAELVDDLAADATLAEGFERRARRARWMPASYGVFPTSDGAVAIGALPNHLDALGAVVGLDLADAMSPDAAARDRVAADLGTALSTRSTADVVAAVEATGIPVGPVRLVEQVLLDPAMVEAGLVDVIDHPRLGPVHLPAPPVRFSATDHRSHPSTPRIGDATDTELRRLGYDEATIARLLADGIVAVAHPHEHTP